MKDLIDKTNPFPKYYQVRELLKQDIDKGKFKPGEMIPSTPQLMQKYSVSQNTVRQAIASLAQKGILYSDHGRGTFVSNLNNIHKDKTETSALIGLLVPSIDRPFVYSEIAASIEVEAHERGYNVLFGNFHHDFVKMKKYIASFAARNVDGIILVPCMTNESTEYEKKNATLIRLLERYSIPFILLDGYSETIKTDSVSMDNERAGFIVTEHLIKQGYKRIAFVKGSYMTSVKDRMKGYAKALNHYGLKFNKNLILKNTASQINSFLSSGSGIDAFVCAHDGIAVKVLEMAGKKGLNVPSDIGVAGFDANASFLNTPIPLTSIHQPVSDIGEKTADLLFDKIEGKRNKVERIFMEPELVVRISSLKNTKNISQIVKFYNEYSKDCMKV